LEWSLTPEVGAVMVNLGGNDMLRGIDPSVARGNLEVILLKVQARKLPVLLVSLKSPGNYGAEYKTAFDAIYGDLAQKYGAVLADDYFAPLMLSPGVLDPMMMQADGIHPNADGVAKIVPVLGAKVLEVLARMAK
jgi:acyl-CoA thioesterase-1